MKEQNYSFFGPDIVSKAEANRNNPLKCFDWDKAASIIKDRLKTNPNLTAEAGLEGDWGYTGGVIFASGTRVSDEYTYLSSTWATPMLIVDDDEIECWSWESDCRFGSDSKWDEISLNILNK